MNRVQISHRKKEITFSLQNGLLDNSIEPKRYLMISYESFGSLHSELFRDI
jgi:hypothetical protein